MKDLYLKIYKTQLKYIEDNTHTHTQRERERERERRKYIPCSCIGKFSIVKIITQPKEIFRFIAVPVKIIMALFPKNCKK